MLKYSNLSLPRSCGRTCPLLFVSASPLVSLTMLNFSRPIYLLDLMVANGDADKAIWISEAAWNPVDSSDVPPEQVLQTFPFPQALDHVVETGLQLAEFGVVEDDHRDVGVAPADLLHARRLFQLLSELLGGLQSYSAFSHPRISDTRRS